MKKKIAFSMIFTVSIAVIIIVGCARNKTEAVVPETKQEIEAVSLLRQYNENLLASMEQGTRAGGWRRGFKIAGADIIGAGNGIWVVAGVALIAGIPTGGVGFGIVAGISGAICGSAASMEVYDQTANCTFQICPEELYELYVADIEVDDTDPVLSINYPERFEYLSEMGAIHNSMLRKLDKFSEEPLTRGLTPHPGGGETDQTPMLAVRVEEIVLTEAYAEGFYAILASISASKNADNTINVEKFCNAMPEGSISENVENIYSLFLDLYTNYPESAEDVEVIINNYISVIEASPDFTDKERESIYMGFSIAASSPFYWIEKLEQED